MVQIDAHQHYWNPLRGDYDWMPMDNLVLARPWLPDDLRPELEAHRVAKTVLVQAATTICETEYLLGIADATDSVAGVVGWVDFENPNDLTHLRRLAQHPKFCGVRPMIQDIADDDWMLRDDVQWAFQALVDLDLTLDALGLVRHLDNFHTILTRYPEMRVVLDHIMKPQIRDHPEELERWSVGMARLARDTSAYCKFSGLVTEASENWTTDHLRPYAAHVLEVFGPDRVMWGSDWPVCLLQASYSAWRDAALDLTAHLGTAERERVFGGTAAEFYRLDI